MEPQRKANIRVVPPPEGAGKKAEQGGPAAPPGASVLSAEAYTHGGVKKTKFEPKVPTRRLKKLSTVKSESAGEGASGGEVPKELQKLLQQAQNDGQRTFRPNQRTSKVAFGFGGFSSRSSAGFRHKSSAGAGSGSGSAKGGGGGGGGGGYGDGGGGSSTRNVEKQEFMHEDEAYPDSKRGNRKNVEVFDLERYYPVSLPWRKPFSGDAQQLDEEEFGDGEEVEEEDEDAVEPAEELGLTEKKEEDTLYFFQLPKGLPLSSTPSVKGKEKEKSPTAGPARLEDLRNGGFMGKILVYESGAVKFKVGDVIYDALPGTECTFSQELCAVNTTTKRCAFLGEVHKRIVLTPDVSNVLPDIANLHT
jgi:DNA-directed RNA polymerase III subunit RPC4